MYSFKTQQYTQSSAS